jgi:hypothetical protein
VGLTDPAKGKHSIGWKLAQVSLMYIHWVFDEGEGGWILER